MAPSAFTKWRNERSANGIRAWQSPPIRPSAAMKLIATITLVVVAAAAGVWGTSALEEQAHDRELFAAYCMGVFGPDQSTLKSPSMPACLTNEPGDVCSERIADIDQERQRVDLNLRQLQESLATQGVIVHDHYTMLAKYLVATSCWEGQ